MEAHNWFYYNSIGAISLILSALMLWVAYMAYRRFLLKRANEKQLEILLALVTEIHNCKNYYFHCHKNTPTNMTPGDPISVFGIKTLSSEYRNIPIYFSQTSMLYWEFYLKYCNNPLLPKSISEHLGKFKLERGVTLNDDVCIIVQNKPNMVQCSFYCISNKSDNTPINLEEFIDMSRDLKKSIIKWFSNYGIGDLSLIDN